MNDPNTPPEFKRCECCKRKLPVDHDVNQLGDFCSQWCFLIWLRQDDDTES